LLGDKIISLARGTGVISLQSIINTFLGTLLIMLAVRMLTKEEFGIYNTLYLTISIGFTIALLGLDQAIVRYLAYFEGVGKPYEALHSAKLILYIASLASIFITLTYLALAPIISQIIFNHQRYTFLLQLTALTIIPTVIGTIALGFIQGLQKFYRLALLRLIAQSSRFISTILLLLIGFNFLALIYGWAIFYITAFIFSLPTFFKYFSKKIKNNNSLTYKELFSFSIPVMGIYLLNYLLNSIDQYIVLAFAGIKSLAEYSIAISASTLIPTVLGIPLITTLTPSMSETYGRLNTQGLSDNINLLSRYIAIIFIPLTLLIASLSPIALLILAGQDYLSASLPLTIINLGLITYGFSIIILSALTALGKTNTILIILALSSILELITSFILTPIYQLNGAAISRALMYTFMFLLLIQIGKRYIKIKLDKVIIVKASLASLLLFMATFTLAYITSFNLLLLPLYLMMALTVYTFSLSLLKALNFNDLQLMLKVIPINFDRSNIIKNILKRLFK